MLKKDLFINTSIQYLEKNRWRAVYNYLCLGKPADDIVGEVVGGVPLDRAEVDFVLTKLRKRGVYL